MTQGIKTVVLGGTGYVAGELLRLIAAHPDFEFAAAVSDEAQALPTAPVRTGPARVMLVGDSVMLTLGRGFERLALEDDDIEVLNAAKIGCPIGQGGVQRIYGRELDEFTHCRHEHWMPLLEAWSTPRLVSARTAVAGSLSVLVFLGALVLRLSRPRTEP